MSNVLQWVPIHGYTTGSRPAYIHQLCVDAGNFLRTIVSLVVRFDTYAR